MGKKRLGFLKHNQNESEEVDLKGKKSNLQILSSNAKLKGSHYELYKSYLHEAIDEGNSIINNIAITGKYGSGKSSIIDTYFSGRDDYLRVSFATFEKTHMTSEKEDQDPDDKDNNRIDSSKISEGNIFANIINQIIYQLDPKKIPLTKFKIKREISKFNKILITIELLLILALFINAGSWMSIFRIIMLISFGIPLFVMFLSNFEFSGFKLTFKNVETEIDMSRDDLFEKYTDEIIYLFKQSGKRILIIEDLDRFNNLDIFEKLRELNIKLNYSDENHWQFIYLLKDSLFKNPNDRVKFFDQIIPIVPFITSSNSIDKLRELFPDNSDRLLQILGTYIDDYRLLINIQSEYNVYKSVADQAESKDQNHRDQDELLALIAYKNLHPSDFDDLQNGKGVLSDLVSRYKEDITNQISNIDEKIKSIEFNRKTFSARNETEYLFLYARRHNLKYHHSGYYNLLMIDSLETASTIINGNLSVSLDGIRNNEVKYDIFKQENFEYNNGILAATVFDEEIQSQQQLKENLKHYKLKSITRDFASHADDLLFALIKNDYISENYLSTINHYYGDPFNLTFMKNIYAENDVDEDLPLSDFKGLLSQLQGDDFDKPQILNVNLVQYLGEHSKNYFENIVKTSRKFDSDVIEKAINQNSTLLDKVVDVTPDIHFKLDVLNRTHTENIIENNRYDDEKDNIRILIDWIQEDDLSILEIINLPNIYGSLKLNIIQGLLKNIDLTDINDQELWDDVLKANAANPSTQNISEYFKFVGELDDTLINFINKNNIIYTTALSDEFYNNLMKQDAVEITHFSALWDSYIGDRRDDFDGLSNDKIEVLADKGILDYNAETISYLVDQNINIPSKYVDQDFIDTVYENALDVDRRTLLFVIGSNNRPNVDVIFSRNVNVLDDNEIRHYITNFGIEDIKLNKIFHKNRGYQNLRFSDNEYIRNILQWLKDNRYISDFTEDDKSKGKLKISITSFFEKNVADD